MTAMQWLNDLVQWFGRLFPRLTMVLPTHRGVLFGPRGGTSEKGPGLVLWWPIAQQLRVVAVAVRSIQVAARCMPHADGSNRRLIVPRVAVCGLAVQYRVVDAVKAATSVINLHALVDNRCQAAIGQSWKDLELARATVVASIEEMKPDLLEDHGVEITRADVTTLGHVVGVLQLQSWAYADTDEGASSTA